jgi:UPF0716 family protein affecting phage T7 exclusion
VERIVLLAGSVLLIFPGLVGDLLGLGAFLGVWAWQRFRRPGAVGPALKARGRS